MLDAATLRGARATSIAAGKGAMRPVHGLGWVLGALAVAVAPHLPYLPAWVSLLLLAVGAWRWGAGLRGWTGAI